MAKVSIRNSGLVGVVRDIDGFDLPPEAWTIGENVRFIDGYATKALGESPVEGPVQVPPLYLFSAPGITAPFWIYTNGIKVYGVSGGVHSDITRATGGDYAATDLDRPWTGHWLNGVFLLNPPGDAPQAWAPIQGAQRLVALGNWSETGVTTLRAEILRGFQNFGIALDITKDSTRFPTTLRWSSPAEPGQIPPSWDVADATELAGEIPLSDTPGYLLDAKPLRGALLVYKEDAVVRLQRVNSNAVFTATFLAGRTGLMGTDCVQEFEPGQHVFLTLDADVAVTDGQTVRRATDRKARRYLEENIDGEARRRSFVVVRYNRREVWVCFPTVGSDYCNRIAVWNWEDNVWSYRDLSDTLSIKSGLYDPEAVSQTWESIIAGTWDEWIQAGGWDARLFAANSYSLLGAFPNSTTLQLMDNGYQIGGASYVTRLERTGLAIVGQDRQGNPKVDETRVKHLHSLVPVVSAPVGTEIDISVGASDTANGSVTWTGPYRFVVGQHDRLEPLNIEGKHLAVRFDFLTDNSWRFYGYDLDLRIVGNV